MIEITPLKIISDFPLRFKTSFLTCFSVLISRLEMVSVKNLTDEFIFISS